MIDFFKTLSRKFVEDSEIGRESLGCTVFLLCCSYKEQIDNLTVEKEKIEKELLKIRQELDFHKEPHTSEELLEKEKERHEKDVVSLKNKARTSWFSGSRHLRNPQIQALESRTIFVGLLDWKNSLQIQSLERKIGELEGDLAASQRELWSQQNDHKKVSAGKMCLQLLPIFGMWCSLLDVCNW